MIPMQDNRDECAICRKFVYLDDEHIQLEPTLIETDDGSRFGDDETYIVHPECWESISDGWLASGLL